MTNHTLLEHTNCNIAGCAICTKAVQLCLVCNGASTTAGGSSLTTECCEKILTEEQKLAIAKGDLDYKNYRWLDKRLGPTIDEVLKEKNLKIDVGHIGCCLNPKEGSYICVGVYKNSNGQTMYAFHQILTEMNRADVGFLSIIHYAKFQEKFGDL